MTTNAASASNMIFTGSTELPATVATWAIYGLASHWIHRTPAGAAGSSEKRPALEKFVDEALPLVAVNLEQFA